MRSLTFLALLGCSSTGLPAWTAPPAGSDAALLTQFETYLEEVERTGYTGVVALQLGERAAIVGLGDADAEAATPFDEETLVPIGSLTKGVLGVVFAQLAAEGAVDINQPLDDLVGDALPVPGDKADLTLHELLTHAAGFDPSLGPDAEQIDRARFWERAMAAPLSRRGRFRYSNVGYSVAAIALEAATGTPHEAHLRRMMDEAGIETLRYDIPAEDRGALAIGYEGNRRWGTILDLPRVEDGPGWNLRGNGGLLATTSDVLRWRGWVAGLDSDVRERAFGMHIEQGGGLDYGYGWDVGVTSRDTQVVNHDGGNGVFYARATWWPDEDAFLFTASNRAEQPAIDFHGRLVAEVIAHLNRGAR